MPIINNSVAAAYNVIKTLITFLFLGSIFMKLGQGFPIFSRETEIGLPETKDQMMSSLRTSQVLNLKYPTVKA